MPLHKGRCFFAVIVAAAVYDGTFTGRKIPGQGVFAALLRENGIPVRDADTLGNTAQF